MSIETSEMNSFQVIRLVSDMVTESDEKAIHHFIQQALSAGNKKFLFSVSVGSLTNRNAMLRLLLGCKEVIEGHGGKLLFLEKNDAERSAFGGICDSLHIPMYQNTETVMVTREKP